MSRIHGHYQLDGQTDTSRPLYDRSPPPPPHNMPPLPSGPPPPRVFGAGDTYRPSSHYPEYPQRTSHDGDSWRPSDDIARCSDRNEFSFRPDDKAPRYLHERERDEAAAVYKAKLRHNPYQNKRAQRGNHGQRPFTYRPPTAERPLLTARGGNLQEQMLGFEQNGVQRFLPAEDLSDSGEDMDESDPESEDPQIIATSTIPRPTMAEQSGVDDDERPAKRRALPTQSVETSSAPKWSNPDPYTVLPPVDDAQRKRKDVVKLIRKARVATEKEEGAQNEVSKNTDFISFGFEDDRDQEDGSRKPGVRGAPTGPRQPNHHNHVGDTQGLMNGAPGTSSFAPSIRNMGPPPGLPSSLPPKPAVEISNNATPTKSATTLPSKPLTNGSAAASNQFTAPNPSADVNGALGRRKRTHNDEIKAQVSRPPPRKKGKGGQSNGSLSNDWIPAQNTDPTPWLIRSILRTENPGFRLHKEVCDFYDFVRPQQFEQIIREDLLDRIQRVVKAELPNCNVHCFGSFAAGLYLPNADMDLVIISERFRDYGQKTACQTKNQMHNFGRYLERTVAERGSIEVIAGAKVPIIKFVDETTSIRVDISFENDTGIIANDTFASWKRQFPAMPVLVTIIKQFLLMRGMNEVATGGLGGFSVTCLVTSMLQNMPRIQNGEIVPEEHLGEMLIEFLDLYGNQLDIARTGISMNPPGYFDKIEFERRSNSVYRANKADRLAIIDPNKPTNDISGGSKNVSLIFSRFSKAHKEIMAALNNPKRPSLLDWLLGGDYDQFVWHRNHLQMLYEQRWGAVDCGRAVDPRADLADYVPSVIHPVASLDAASCSIPAPKLSKKKKKKPKQQEQPAHSAASESRAKVLKSNFPSIAKQLPNSVRQKNAVKTLEGLYQYMKPKEQKRFMTQKDQKQPKFLPGPRGKKARKVNDRMINDGT